MKLFLILASAAIISCNKVNETWLPEPKFPEGEHKELVASTCTACHSARLVLQNRMDRQTWDETLTWMEKKHNLPELDEEDREHILDYLESQLSPEELKSMDGLPPRRVNPLPKT